MSASAIIALAEIALKNKMDVADTPSFLGLPDYTPLGIDAVASDESEFERLILVLRQWCDHRLPSGCLDLTIRFGPSKLMIEQTTPVEGYKAIVALLTDITETIRLLRQASLLKHVTRILVTSGHHYGEAYADIGDRSAYWIAPRVGVIRKAPVAENVSRGPKA
jgi:hypothetical protein